MKLYQPDKPHPYGAELWDQDRVKSELKSARERLHDKKTLMQNYSYESENLLKQIESTFLEVFDRNTNSDKVRELKVSLSEKKERNHILIFGNDESN